MFCSIIVVLSILPLAQDLEGQQSYLKLNSSPIHPTQNAVTYYQFYLFESFLHAVCYSVLKTEQYICRRFLAWFQSQAVRMDLLLYKIAPEQFLLIVYSVSSANNHYITVLYLRFVTAMACSRLSQPTQYHTLYPQL